MWYFIFEVKIQLSINIDLIFCVNWKGSQFKQTTNTEYQSSQTMYDTVVWHVSLNPMIYWLIAQNLNHFTEYDVYGKTSYGKTTHSTI